MRFYKKLSTNICDSLNPVNYTFFELVQYKHLFNTYTQRYKRALGLLLNHFVLQNALSVNVKLNLHLNWTVNKLDLVVFTFC